VCSFISSVALLFVGEYFFFLDGMAGAFRCVWVFLFWFYRSGAWVVLFGRWMGDVQPATKNN
jgi:hypothetical protein